MAAELTHESRERSVKKSDQLSLRSLEPSNPSETLQQQLHSNGSPARGNAIDTTSIRMPWISVGVP